MNVAIESSELLRVNSGQPRGGNMQDFRTKSWSSQRVPQIGFKIFEGLEQIIPKYRDLNH